MIIPYHLLIRPFISSLYRVHIFNVANHFLQQGHIFHWLLPVNDYHGDMRKTQESFKSQLWLEDPPRFLPISFSWDYPQSRSLQSNLFSLSLSLGIRITSWSDNIPYFSGFLPTSLRQALSLIEYTCVSSWTTLLRGPGHESGAKNGPKKQAARWGLETGSKVAGAWA